MTSSLNRPRETSTTLRLDHLRRALFLLLTLAATALHAQPMVDLPLEVEEVTTGLSLPTTMGFVAPDDILVLQKNGWIGHADAQDGGESGWNNSNRGTSLPATPR